MFEKEYEITPKIEFIYDEDEYCIDAYGESIALGKKVFIAKVNNKLTVHLPEIELDRFIYDEINKTHPELLV